MVDLVSCKDKKNSKKTYTKNEQVDTIKPLILKLDIQLIKVIFQS